MFFFNFELCCKYEFTPSPYTDLNVVIGKCNAHLCHFKAHFADVILSWNRNAMICFRNINQKGIENYPFADWYRSVTILSFIIWANKITYCWNVCITFTHDNLDEAMVLFMSFVLIHNNRLFITIPPPIHADWADLTLVCGVVLNVEENRRTREWDRWHRKCNPVDRTGGRTFGHKKKTYRERQNI